MNQEKLKFIAEGDGYESGDCGMFAADITVVGELIWYGRIQTYGGTPADAEQLRARLLWALEQPTVPTLWQGAYLVSEPEFTGQIEWRNLEHGGEAAREKGKGFEVRALYTKNPLPEAHHEIDSNLSGSNGSSGGNPGTLVPQSGTGE